MSYRTKVILLAAVASLLLGWLTTPLALGVKAAYPEPTLDAEMSTFSDNLGQGLSVAILGGYRNISANLVWVSMYADWQYRRKEDTLSKMNLAVALNPSSLFFWVDGARMIANDMPVWEVGDAAAGTLFETTDGIEVRYRYGRTALDFLGRAPESIAVNSKVLREKAVIHWKKLDDLKGALIYFEQAVAQPNAPYYLSRVYAEILIKDGQINKAHTFLQEHFASLPDDDMRAMKSLVAKRIQDLTILLQQAD